MRKTILTLLSFVCIAGFAFAADEDGFKPIFNGQNLDGWIIQGLEKAGPKIQPEGVMALDGWDYWGVISKTDYQNFILRFDCKLDPKGNSGVLIHTDKKQIYKSAFEIQLAADAGEEVTNKSTGAIFGLVAPKKNASKPVGEWNAVEVKVQDNKLTVTINGEVVQDGVDLTKVEGIKHKFEKGSIAFQRNDYKKAAYIKNIRVKTL